VAGGEEEEEEGRSSSNTSTAVGCRLEPRRAPRASTRGATRRTTRCTIGPRRSSSSRCGSGSTPPLHGTGMTSAITHSFSSFPSSPPPSSNLFPLPVPFLYCNRTPLYTTRSMTRVIVLPARAAPELARGEMLAYKELHKKLLDLVMPQLGGFGV